MKAIYWRPRKVAPWVLPAIMSAALGGWALVEYLPSSTTEPHQQEKLSAARLARRGMNVIKAERLRQGHQIEPRFDPSGSGLIGLSMSRVTSVPGNLRAKQTSINPNFAAAVVDMLHEAGVKRGDSVAVGCSGSFPALNLAVYAALETIGARPIVVSSCCASQFGANLPELMWIDMERLLFDEGLISFQSLAASVGGYEDDGRGMSEDTRHIVTAAIERNGLKLIDSDSLGDSIDQRMEIYRSAADGRRVAAYINVGGGAASVGRTAGKNRYAPGLNLSPPAEALEIDSVMTRFARRGTPVIHLVEANELAAELGLPAAPAVLPAAGSGGVFERTHYNRPLAALLLVLIVAALRLLVWNAPVARLRQWLRARRGETGGEVAAPRLVAGGGE